MKEIKKQFSWLLDNQLRRELSNQLDAELDHYGLWNKLNSELCVRLDRELYYDIRVQLYK